MSNIYIYMFDSCDPSFHCILIPSQIGLAVQIPLASQVTIANLDS